MVQRVLMLAVAALLTLVGCSTAALEKASSSSSPAGAIGTPVSDGKFQFTVTSVDRSAVAGDPTNEFLQTKAQDEFVNVHLTVKNTGDKAQDYFAANQKLVVGGKQYDAHGDGREERHGERQPRALD